MKLLLLPPRPPAKPVMLCTAGSASTTCAARPAWARSPGTRCPDRRERTQQLAGVLLREEARAPPRTDRRSAPRPRPGSASSAGHAPAPSPACDGSRPAWPRSHARTSAQAGPAAGVRPARRAAAAHIIGVSVSDTTSDTAMAADSVTANSRNSRPTTPPISRIGMNTATSDRLMDSTVKPTSRDPRSAAHRRHATLDVAHDVLQHHDGVVHHEAGGHDQRHQRDRVQRVAAQVHDAEGADQRHRHRDAGDQRGAPAAQEQQHHQHHQAHRDDQRQLGLVQ